MLVRSSALALCILTTIPPAALASASLRPLTLPVRHANQTGIAPGTPSYAGDAFEVRVTSRASAALAVPARPGRMRAVGVPSLEGAAAALGAWFEPEFAGESRPAPGGSDVDFTSFLIVHLPDGARLEDALARFAGLGEVESVSPLPILPLTITPNDSLFPLSPWFDQPSNHDIHATEAWDVTVGHPNVVVAVLDAGVVAGHPDLSGVNPQSSGNIWTNVAEANGVPGVDDDGNGFVDDVHGWDFVNLGAASEVKPGEDWRDEDNDPNDMVGHGTICAGLIGALSNNTIGVTGTAWNVRIMPLRIGYAFPGASLGAGEVRMDFVARAVRYATRMGAQVLSCSFANLDTDGLGAAVTAATHAGISVVVSAGNNGSPNDLANRSDVLSIAAVDGSDVVAAFSNTGPLVDLAAPGVGMRSTYIQPTGTDSLGLRAPGYGSGFNGTSLSAPLVSGAIALLQAQQISAGRPPFGPAAVKLRLTESADDIRAQNPGLDGQYGAGRLDLQRMLTIPTPSFAIPIGANSVGPSAVITRKSGPAKVAFATSDGRLVLLDGATGTVIWTAPLPGPAATGVAAADLGGGHGVGLFVGTVDGSMAGFDINGQPLAGFPTPAIGIPLAGGPALGDIDGDGVLEIVCGADDGDLYAWHANGVIVAGFPRTTGVGRLRMPPALAEIDSLAAGVEIVVANEVGNLRVVRGNGTLINALSKTYAATPRAPIVMRYGQGTTAIVVAEDVRLHAYQITGAELPGYPVTLDGPALSDPAVADLDVDGVLDVVLATDAPQQLDARDSTGAHLPGWPRPLGSGIVGTPVIGQLSGVSSLFELLIFRGASLHAFNNTGDSLALRPQSGGAGLLPTIADLDADGETDIVAGTGSDSAFYIYSAGPGSFTFGPTAWPTPRANMARTGSTRYSARPAFIDDVAPAGVVDLVATSVTANSVTLHWTAPGDDGMSGTAERYEIKYSTSPIDAGNFDAAPGVSLPPFPSAGGSPESLQVTALLEGFHYWFAVRAVDGAGNHGSISNIVDVSTTAISPAQVTDLRATDATDSTVSLIWTASGNDGFVGRPSYYELRASTAPLTAANFDDAPYQQIIYALVDAGGVENGLFRGLPHGAQLSLALKAVDLGGNASPLSNVITVSTTGGPLSGRVGIALAPAINPGRPPLSIYWQADPAGATGNQRMRIYDVGGRIQKTIDLGPGNNGIAIWDGRTDGGERAPAGLYFVRFESGGHAAKARVALLP